MNKAKNMLPVAFGFIDAVVFGQMLQYNIHPRGAFQVKLNGNPYRVVVRTQPHPEEKNDALCVRLEVQDENRGILRMILMDPVLYVQRDGQDMQA